MKIQKSSSTSAGARVRHSVLFAVALAAGVSMVAACGNSGSSASSSAAASTQAQATGTSSSGAAAGQKSFTIAFVVKDISNPFWVSMIKSGKAEAAKLGVKLQVTAAQNDSDTSTQINAIEDAVTAGDKGIIVDTNGNAINPALKKARSAGLAVFGIDTPTIPANAVELTYATNNSQAGQLIGKWAASKMDGHHADIALLDDLTSEVVSLDVGRDHGFLKGMGIPVGNPNINGKEPKSGHYTGGKGGSYNISCQLPTGGAIPGGLKAMETCLSKDPSINLVYAINEPAAQGAIQALKAAHAKATVVAIDGGCAFLPFVKSGAAGADAGQFPGKMAKLAVDAVVKQVRDGVKPKPTPGLDYFNTGATLYTDSPQPGVPSINTTKAASTCWG